MLLGIAKTTKKAMNDNQDAVPATQRRAEVQKSLEKVVISLTELYTQLGQVFVFTFCAVSFFMLQLMLKYSQKMRSTDTIDQTVTRHK